MKNIRLGTTAVIGSMALLAACSTTEPEAPVEVVETTPVAVEPQLTPMEEAVLELEEAVGHRVFFGYDQYNLTADAQAILRRQASFLNAPENQGISVLIAGNCDERGTREYNLALGKRRADEAKAFLVSLGVDESRINVVSYGKERPIDPRSTPEAWAKNRNATTTIRTMGATSTMDDMGMM